MSTEASDGSGCSSRASSSATGSFAATLSTQLGQEDEQTGVEKAFRAFSGARGHLDGRSFAKLCKDCGLVDKKLTVTEVDLTFAKVVPKGQRYLDLEDLTVALRMIAHKKGLTE